MTTRIHHLLRGPKHEAGLSQTLSIHNGCTMLYEHNLQCPDEATKRVKNDQPWEIASTIQGNKTLLIEYRTSTSDDGTPEATE